MAVHSVHHAAALRQRIIALQSDSGTPHGEKRLTKNSLTDDPTRVGRIIYGAIQTRLINLLHDLDLRPENGHSDLQINHS
jgi:hypothetical protein